MNDKDRMMAMVFESMFKKELKELITEGFRRSIKQDDMRVLIERGGFSLEEVAEMRKEAEKSLKKKRKRPPVNPNYKPTVVDIEPLLRRMRAESDAVMRRLR